MPFKLEKLKKRKMDIKSRFRLIHNIDGIDVIFNRYNFRDVLECLGLSSGRIGYIVKLLNKVDPLPVRYKSLPDDLTYYSENFLVDYLKPIVNA